MRTLLVAFAVVILLCRSAAAAQDGRPAGGGYCVEHGSFGREYIDCPHPHGGRGSNNRGHIAPVKDWPYALRVPMSPFFLAGVPIGWGFCILMLDPGLAVKLGEDLVNVTEPLWIGPYYAVYGVGYGFYWVGSTIFSGPANMEARIEERRAGQIAAKRASDAAVTAQTRALARWKVGSAATEVELRDIINLDRDNLAARLALGGKLDRKADGVNDSGVLPSHSKGVLEPAGKLPFDPRLLPRGPAENGGHSTAGDQALSARFHAERALLMSADDMKEESNKVWDTLGRKVDGAIVPIKKEGFNPNREPQIPKEKMTPAILKHLEKREEQKKIIAAAEAELKKLDPTKPEDQVKIVEQRTIQDKANNQLVFTSFVIDMELQRQETSDQSVQPDP